MLQALLAPPPVYLFQAGVYNQQNVHFLLGYKKVSGQLCIIDSKADILTLKAGRAKYRAGYQLLEWILDRPIRMHMHSAGFGFRWSVTVGMNSDRTP
jgi:hypothetical protein